MKQTSVHFIAMKGGISFFLVANVRSIEVTMYSSFYAPDILKLSKTTASLCKYIITCLQLLNSKTIELDNLKAEWTAKLNDQMARHKQELATEKEKSYQVN